MAYLPDYWFNNSVSTQRATVTIGTSGGVSYTYADNLTNQMVRFNPGGGNISTAGGLLLAMTSHIMYCRVMDLLPHDRVILGSRVFDVESVNDFDEAGIYYKVSLKEVEV